MYNGTVHASKASAQAVSGQLCCANSIASKSWDRQIYTCLMLQHYFWHHAHASRLAVSILGWYIAGMSTCCNAVTRMAAVNLCELAQHGGLPNEHMLTSKAVGYSNIDKTQIHLVHPFSCALPSVDGALSETKSPVIKRANFMSCLHAHESSMQ